MTDSTAGGDETMLEERSVPAMLVNQARRLGVGTALLEKDLGRWIEYSWNDYLETAQRLALALETLGVAAGDAVGIIGENTPQWLFMDLAIQSVGGFTVGIFPTTPAPEVAYILGDCGARVVVVGDQEQADKVLVAAEADDTRVERIIYIDPKGVSYYDLPMLLAYEDLLRTGEELVVHHPERFLELLNERDPDDISLVGYTSGTTGLSKGVIITHRNMIEMTKVYQEVFPTGPDDRCVVFIPVGHPAVRGPQVYTSFRSGMVVTFPEDPDTFLEAFHEVAPTYVMGTTRLLETVSADIRLRVGKTSPLRRAVFNVGLALGERAYDREIAHGRPGLLGRVYQSIAWALVGKAVLEKLGLDKVRWITSGGMALSTDLCRFFHALGLPVRQIYGQSETAGVSFAQYADPVRPGRSGKLLPSLEARLGDRGELLLRGPGVFTGYLNKPGKTREAIDDDGWFHTGDLAEFTEDGELVLIDRESAMMRLADGTVIAPTDIENRCKFSPYVADAVVIASNRPYVAVLIQLEYGTVAEWAQTQNLGFTTFRSLTQLPPVQGLIAELVAEINQELPEAIRIREFRLLPKELDVDDDELTPTGKVKRTVLNERFSDLIESMYERAADGTPAH